MHAALRTAGCPAAERNVLTKPTGGASPVSTSVGVDSPLAPPRPQGRAVPFSRRREGSDNFLGREGRSSQSPVRKARWQTLYSCLVQPAGTVDTRFLNESLAPVSRASSTTRFTKNWNHSVPSAVRPSMSKKVKLRQFFQPRTLFNTSRLWTMNGNGQESFLAVYILARRTSLLFTNQHFFRRTTIFTQAEIVVRRKKCCMHAARPSRDQLPFLPAVAACLPWRRVGVTAEACHHLLSVPAQPRARRPDTLYLVRPQASVPALAPSDPSLERF